MIYCLAVTKRVASGYYFLNLLNQYLAGAGSDKYFDTSKELCKPVLHVHGVLQGLILLDDQLPMFIIKFLKLNMDIKTGLTSVARYFIVVIFF
jgi:hypothetical protein